MSPKFVRIRPPTHPAPRRPRCDNELRRRDTSGSGDYARHRLTPLALTAGAVERRLGVARDRIAIGAPGAPDWTPRPAAPKDGDVLCFGTLEPGKSVRGLLHTIYRQGIERRAEAARRA